MTNTNETTFTTLLDLLVSVDFDREKALLALVTEKATLNGNFKGTDPIEFFEAADVTYKLFRALVIDAMTTADYAAWVRKRDRITALYNMQRDA